MVKATVLAVISLMGLSLAIGLTAPLIIGSNPPPNKKESEHMSETSYIIDTFSRSVSNAWGTSDTGSTYVITANRSGATYSVNGSKGLVQLGATDLSTRAAIHENGTAIVAGDFDARVTVSASALATGEALVARILGRFVNPSNTYVCNVAFQTDGYAWIELDIVEGGVGNHFIPPIAKYTYSPGQEFTMRFRAVGDDLMVKLWPANQDEPVGWDIAVQDGTFSAPGGMGIRTDALPGNSNSNAVITYDNLQIAYAATSSNPVPPVLAVQTLGWFSAYNGAHIEFISDTTAIVTELNP